MFHVKQINFMAFTKRKKIPQIPQDFHNPKKYVSRETFKSKKTFTFLFLTSRKLNFKRGLQNRYFVSRETLQEPSAAPLP